MQNTRPRYDVVLLLTALLAISGCGALQVGIEDETSVALGRGTKVAMPQGTSHPQATAIPSVSKTPTDVPQPQTPAGSVVSSHGVTFSLDPALGSVISSGVDPSDPWKSMTFRLSMIGSEQVGRLSVIPLPLPEGPGPDISSVQSAIESQSTFPVWGAAMLLQAQTSRLDFQSGTGLRAVVMAAQNHWYVNNADLSYHYVGLTQDRKALVSAQLPIKAPILMSTGNPAENTHPQAILAPAFADGMTVPDAAQVEAYHQQVQPLLDQLDAASFSPSLTALDDLMTSLQVAPGQ
jgi:hypothetical protein